jgi:hypothetical protein
MPDPLATLPRTGFIDWLTRPGVSLATIWLLGLLVFLPALWGPWLLDDVHIRDSVDAVHTSGLDALAGDAWKTHIFLGSTGIGRPLAMATFAGNALISADPVGFKAVNLVLHLITAALVYLLARVLMGTRYEPDTADRAALVVALLWTLHPLQISTVGYVVQRMTILSALFSVWAMLLYARLRIAGRGGVVAWALPLCVLPGLAILSKETGFLIPVLLLALEATLFRFRDQGRSRRLLAAYFGVVAAFGLALGMLLLLDPDRLLAGYGGRPFDLAERLLTQARVVAMYVGQILLPRLNAMPFFYDGLPHSTGWLSPSETLTSAVFLLALACLALAVLRRRPLAAFGIVLFFAGHLMESTILPLELAFEHRNYLPSLGLILAAVDLAVAACRVGAWLGPILAGVAVAALFALSLTRAFAWSSAEHIYSTAIAGTWPSQRARAELAQVLTDRGRFRAARQILAGAVGSGPRLQEGYLDCRETGRMDPERIAAARAQLGNSVADYDTSALIIVVNLALDRTCAIAQPDLLALVADAAGAPAMQPSSRQKLLMYVGHLRHELGDGEGALAALEAAFAVVPANPMPLLLAAHWRLDAGDWDGATALYDRGRAAGSPGRLDLDTQFSEVAQRLRDAPPGASPGATAPAVRHSE